MAASHGAAALLSLVVLACFSPVALHAADTHLHFFFHDVVTGSNPTAVRIIKGPGSNATGAIPGLAFGDTIVIDNALTATSSATSAAVGRAQGFYMVSSQSGPVLLICVNLLLTTGDYNGSTLAVIGPDDIMATVRELSVVGGTGKFRMATGYVLWKTTSTSGPDATIELDVYATTPNGTTIDADAPVSPVDRGGATGKSSSGAPAARGPYRWANACVTAVLVALVGCFW